MALQAAAERVGGAGQRKRLQWLRRALANRWTPRLALCLVLAFSIAAKAIDINQPCESPCTAGRHGLIFDEQYYVNAARVIDGIEPPKGAPYHGAPFGDDPNAEHPQLAKLVIAGGIELFGDTPLGWRIGSILFAAVALLALYALVRAAGGGAWLAVGTCGVMSLDNLMLVSGRIGTLDIYAVAMMIVSAVLYMRARPILAGLALGVAVCMKEVSVALVFVLVLFEALMLAHSWWTARATARLRRAADARLSPEPTGYLGRGAAAMPAGGEAGLSASRRLLRLGLFTLTGAAAALGLLWLLDVLVPAYDPGTHEVYAGNPISHLLHMYNYAQLLKAKPGEPGIASHPLAWLLDEKAINYYRVAVNTLVGGKVVATRDTIRFEGVINPFIIFLAIPATFAALASAWRDGDRLAALGACWCLGTYLPFLIGAAASGRVTYLYYMVIVMPGLYIVTARLFASRRMPTAATVGWAIALIYGFIHLYPLRTLL